MAEPADVSAEVITRLSEICLGLPEAYQEEAWVGTRWRVRERTFAHVLTVDDGWPPAYARALGGDGPATLLTFESAGPELAALRRSEYPFFAPPWRATVVGMVLEASVDWDEVSELLVESYRAVAPKRLVDALDQPGE